MLTRLLYKLYGPSIRVFGLDDEKRRRLLMFARPF